MSSQRPEDYDRSSFLDIYLHYNPEVEINPLMLSTTLEINCTVSATYNCNSWAGKNRKGRKLSEKLNYICRRACATQKTIKETL